MSLVEEQFFHQTVLLQEVVDFLVQDFVSETGECVFVDATLGGGGHAKALLQSSAPCGKLIGFDRDEVALQKAQQELKSFSERTTFVHSEFGDVAEILLSMNVPVIQGLVADLGVSSYQLDAPSRGFSFRNEGPLDMRMNDKVGESALELLHRVKEKELADILYQYGEERKSFAIAKSICREISLGKLQTTLDLRRAVVRVLGPRRGKTDPATRTFQAIRIAVNRELEQLEKLLEGLEKVLEVGSNVAIISFHSVEDRIVKHFFKNASWLYPLTKKPVLPSEEEIARNPRARSAKLRVAQRISSEVQLKQKKKKFRGGYAA